MTYALSKMVDSMVYQRFFLPAVLTKEMLQLCNNIVSIRETDQNRDLESLSSRLCHFQIGHATFVPFME